MIRINLARKKTANYASSVSGSGGLSDSLKSLSAGGLKSFAPLLLILGVPAGLGIGANLAFDNYVEQRSADMQNQISSIGKEKEKVNSKLQQIKGFEIVKEQLEKNSSIIRIKIDTIEKLIRERDFTAKALINLSNSIPKEVWLTEFKDNSADYEIRGATTDAGLVTDFMTRLQKNIYFKEVQLKSTSVTDQMGNQADFSLSGRRE